MTLEVDKDVLWLEVSVDNVPTVQVLYGSDDLRDDLAGIRLSETPLVRQVEKQLSSWTELENKVQVIVSLERAVQLDDKWAVQRCQYVSLEEHFFQFLLLDDFILVDDFHGTKLSIVSPAGKQDS